MHEQFMRRALELAEKGRGLTGINPMVGAVLVRDRKIIAEGFHEGFGKAHAERQLLEKFVQKIDSKDTLYVNLEPCCHTHKKTPPCAQFLIERGIKNVVYGMKDPNPEVAGKGIELLNKNNVQNFVPILEQKCKRLNRGFISLMTKHRPWITLKNARTIDGKYFESPGHPLKITNDTQDRWSHEFLRARHDAILVGVGTIVADDASLSVRFDMQTNAQPYRLILDRNIRIPLTAKVLTDRHASRTIVIADSLAERGKIDEIESRGARVIRLPFGGYSVDWPSVWKALTTPGQDFFGITSILVEGGPTTWEKFRNAKLVDEEVTLVG